jgi:hypothetical protein
MQKPRLYLADTRVPKEHLDSILGSHLLLFRQPLVDSDSFDPTVMAGRGPGAMHKSSSMSFGIRPQDSIGSDSA